MTYRFSFFVFIFVTLFLSTLATARYYNGDEFTFYQPDGTPFEVRLFGDEYYSVIETTDGYTLTKDPETGFYQYAEAEPDGLQFALTGVKAGEDLPDGHGLTKGIRLLPQRVKEKSAAARSRFGVDGKGRLLHTQRIKMRPRDLGYLQWNSDIEEQALMIEASKSGPSPAPPSSATTGRRVGLILLAQFPDRSADVTITQAQVDAYANDPDYTEFNNATSVYGYYYIQSNGKLQYNCIVSAYFTAANPRSYYTDNGVAFGTRAKELINEGLEALKSDGFDFTQIDANNDNVLDGVNLFYAGDRVNSWSEGLWPHKWSSSWSGLTDYGISTGFQYQITDMGTSLSLGTFCHENGHMLCDFPDLYSYSGNAAEINNYSLMSQSGTTHPVSVDAYLKLHAGWATIKDIVAADHERGALQVDQNTFYRFRNPAKSTEYFLLSMRTDAGYEGVYGGSPSTANPTSGLIIWHAYESGSNTYSSIFTADSPTANYTTPYELMVVEANPASVTNPWYDAPNPGTNDAWHSGDLSEASDATTPALKFWNTANGRTTLSNMHIHSVSAQGSTMTFITGTGALAQDPAIGLTTATLSPLCDYGSDADAQQFSVFNTGSGTLNYSISESISWLSLDTVSGSATTEADLITVTYNTDELTSGTHNGTITITDNGATNSPQTISVSLTVENPPVIATDKTELELSVTAGASLSETFAITNSGGGTLRYSVADSASWLTTDRSSGTVAAESDEIHVSCDASGLFDGTYTAEITVTDDTGQGDPVTISVSLQVTGNIIVLYPEGEESLWQGNPCTIRWKTDDTVTGTVSILLYKNNVENAVISTGQVNDGLFRWTIPGAQTIGTDYRIRVVSDDSAGINGSSLEDFSIAALPSLTAVPYSESFEADTGTWTQASDDDFDWTRDSGGTPSSSTGPSSAPDGSFYMYTESSSPNYPIKTALLENVFDLRSKTAPLFSFDYHMYGSTTGTLSVTASTDQKEWTTLFSKTGNQGDVWNQKTADLSSFAGQAVSVRITGTTGSSYYSDMAVDAIRISEATKKLVAGAAIFSESVDNDGSVGNSITITLTGDTFTADAVSGGHVTMANLPAGLSALFVRESDTELTVSLTGNAETHRNEDSVYNLQVVFSDTAFTSGNASLIAGSLQTFSIDYFDEQHRISVTLTGIGEGTVTSSPAGIDCGETCFDDFTEGDAVTLFAVPANPSSRFTGWSGGGCSGTGNCNITVTEAVNITAAFDADDTDGDNVPDYLDAFPEDPDYFHDGDNDGLPTAWENRYGFNTALDDSEEDPDGDTLSNLEEYRMGTDPVVQTSGPGQAVLISPSDGAAGISLTPKLEAGYADGALEEHHQKTIWMISTTDSFLDPVFQLTSSDAKRSVVVPHGILNPGTEYYWRARYIDSGNTEWPWADSRSFTTTDSVSPDSDGNGIPDTMDIASGTEIDLDLDGRNDLTQSGMHSLSISGSVKVSLREGDGVSGLELFEWIPTDTIDAVSGMGEWVLNFRLQVAAPGDEATVTVFFSSPLETGAVWYKYDTINGWADFSDHAVVSSDRTSVTLTLKDGGFGDADGVENGVIADPSGPVASVGLIDTNSAGGGCFIRSLYPE